MTLSSVGRSKKLWLSLSLTRSLSHSLPPFLPVRIPGYMLMLTHSLPLSQLLSIILSLCCSYTILSLSLWCIAWLFDCTLFIASSMAKIPLSLAISCVCTGNASIQILTLKSGSKFKIYKYSRREIWMSSTKKEMTYCHLLSRREKVYFKIIVKFIYKSILTSSFHPF